MKSKWRKLDLSALEDPYDLREVESLFRKGDGEGFGSLGYSTGSSLALVCDNLWLLKERGIYESALLSAYTGCKGTNRNWDLKAIRKLFELADREKLKVASAAFPPLPITAYRGVSGTGALRRERGFSWTLSLNVACWFSLRCPHSTVLKCTFKEDRVWAFVSERSEQEIIGLPGRITKVKITKGEIQRRGHEWMKLMREEQKKEIEAALKRHRKSQ